MTEQQPLVLQGMQADTFSARLITMPMLALIVVLVIGGGPAMVRALIRVAAIVVAVGLLSGCATSTGPRLSSLGREVRITPARQQTEAQRLVDDRECETWTRANTGTDAPFPDKGLRYAACVVSRGYLAELFYVPVADPAGRSLDGVVSDWQACNLDAAHGTAAWGIGPALVGRHRFLSCLTKRGYAVEEPRTR